MQALELAAIGGDGPRLVEVLRPEPAAGQVRVALRAAALNHRELFILQGQYPGMALPCTLGADGAGIVDAVGDGVPQARIGERVVLYPGMDWGDDQRFPGRGFHLLGMPAPGTIAEHICVPAGSARPMPPHLDFAQAAALPTAALTAWRGLTAKAALQPGETLLITGIGGGVATYALLFGRAMGARVYVTSSRADTIARAVDLGAEAGFDYRDKDWHKAFLKASGGADVVFDGAPAGSMRAYTRALRMGARIVVYGSTGGVDAGFLAPSLFLSHATIHGTAMGSPADFTGMLEFVAAKGLTPVIDRRFALAQASQALDYLRDGHAFGKVVIDIPGES